MTDTDLAIKGLRELEQGLKFLNINFTNIPHVVAILERQQQALSKFENSTEYKTGFKNGYDVAFATGLVGDTDD